MKPWKQLTTEEREERTRLAYADHCRRNHIEPDWDGILSHKDRQAWMDRVKQRYEIQRRHSR